MDLNSSRSTARVVRVSLTWLLVGVGAIIVLGMVGGTLAAQLWMPGTASLVTGESNRLVSTVQEITISPNTAVTQMLETAQRSVVLLKRGATAFVVTNDGMLVTAGEVPAGEIVAYDYQGKTITLEFVGRDELFGLMYLRAREAVLIPLDMRSEPVPVAYELIAVSRSLPSLFMQAESFRVSEHILPPELMPAGLQQVMKGTQLAEAALVGSPLLDDEGLVAGLLINSQAGLALPFGHLKESLNRVVGGQREKDLLADLGLELHYTFAAASETEARQFVAEVRTVLPNSIAAAAGLKRGDRLVQIADRPLEWENSVLTGLSQDWPLELTVNRADKQIVVVLRDLEEDN